MSVTNGLHSVGRQEIDCLFSAGPEHRYSSIDLQRGKEGKDFYVAIHISSIVLNVCHILYRLSKAKYGPHEQNNSNCSIDFYFQSSACNQ